jgi:hypothetical protein
VQVEFQDFYQRYGGLDKRVFFSNLCFLFPQSNLNGHKNLIEFVDSSISTTDNGVHEVLLLMPYHKVKDIIKIFIFTQLDCIF